MSILKRLQDTGSLKAFWDFRRGTLRDWSGNGYDLTVVGAPRWIATPSGNGVLTQSGTASYLSAGNPDALKLGSTLTMVAVCTPIVSKTYRCVFGKDKAPQMYVHNGSLRLYSGGTTVVGNPIPKMGFPTMLGGTIRLDVAGGTITYINGQQGPSGILSVTNQLKDWLVGANYDVEQLDGSVQLAAITDSILTPQQMSDLYLDWTRESYTLDTPHRHYSFPYKTLSPAQATTQGLVLDTDFVRSSDGKVRNFAPTSYTGTLVGNPVPAGEGNGMTFDGVDDYINFGDVTEINGATKLTVSGWFYQHSYAGGGASGYWGKSNSDWTNRIGIALVAGAFPSPLFFYVMNGNNAYGTTVNSVNPGTWQHVTYVYDGSGATNADRLKAYIDGTQWTLNYTNTVGTTLANVSGSPLLVGCERPVATHYANQSARLFRVRSGVALTAAQVRAEYLEGAKELLVDGRLRNDGSCPVSLTPFTTPNSRVPTTDWNTGAAAGTVSVFETANREERYIQLNNGGRIGINDTNAFGSWYWETFCATENPVMFIADNILRYDVAPQNGYLFYAGVNLQFGKTTNGTFAGLSTLVSTNVINHRIRCWVSRTPACVFTFWISDQGGPWTQVATFTDSSFTFGKYAVLCSNSLQQLYSYLHFAGAMTPAEAIGLGLIDP